VVEVSCRPAVAAIAAFACVAAGQPQHQAQQQLSEASAVEHAPLAATHVVAVDDDTDDQNEALQQALQQMQQSEQEAEEQNEQAEQQFLQGQQQAQMAEQQAGQ
jgi:hypothetical protein